MSDYGPSRAVTREEFVKAWAVVTGMAHQVDDLVKAQRILATRLQQLDRLVRDVTQQVDALMTTKVDA